jgi:hypothetical protein
MNEFGVDLNELLKEEAMGGMSVGGGGNSISGVSPNPQNPDNLPDTFLSKDAQKRHVRNAMKTIVRRKRR